MSRVEWTRLSGEEAETVLSIMLYRDWPRAVQVRPSHGDGGLDVVVPNEEHLDRIDVWQIKKFASNLGPSEKRQIDRSFVRLLRVIAANEHQVANWHLLMPLNPTRENQQWFAEIGARALRALTGPSRKKQQKKTAAKKVAKKAATKTVPTAQSGPNVSRASSRSAAPVEETETVVSGPISADALERVTSWLADERFMRQWDGLIACEALAAKYPDVIDYYLHGGRERVDSAVARMASLLHGDRSIGDPAGPPLQPVDLRDHLRTVQAALDGDPHYRYGVSLDPHPPPIPLEPGLVAATRRSRRTG